MEDSSMDLEAVEGCRSRITPVKSQADQPYALTVNTSTDSLYHNANLTPGQPVKWTDEKHSLYLGFLEASFVNQLHGSTGLLGCHSQKKALDPNTTMNFPSKTCNSPDQFTVLHSGCWKKKKFERNEPTLNPAPDSHVILKNPWICHFRSAGKGRIATSGVQERTKPSRDGFLSEKRNSSPGLETCPEQFYACPSCHQDSVGSITEVSDQNFEDEDQGNKTSSLSMAKRFRVDAADASSNDQVVPSTKLCTTEVITSVKREDCVSHPYPESRVCH